MKKFISSRAVSIFNGQAKITIPVELIKKMGITNREELHFFYDDVDNCIMIKKKEEVTFGREE